MLQETGVGETVTREIFDDKGKTGVGEGLTSVIEHVR